VVDDRGVPLPPAFSLLEYAPAYHFLLGRAEVVFVSAKADGAMLERATAPAPIAFLSKPFPPREIGVNGMH
jgi:hypothetical protein